MNHQQELDTERNSESLPVTNGRGRCVWRMCYYSVIRSETKLIQRPPPLPNRITITIIKTTTL